MQGKSRSSALTGDGSAIGSFSGNNETHERVRRSALRFQKKAMAPISGLHLFSVSLTFVLGSLQPIAAQVRATTSVQPAQFATLSPISPVERPASFLQDADGDFRKRVEARWNAARKGLIQVYVAPDAAKPETFTVRVVVTRAPAGSDGMRAPSSDTPSWSTLLKLDDEVLVKLSAESVGALDVDEHDVNPYGSIRRLDPGGHAEWTWTVRRIKPGENRLLLQADVVYRRKFSAGGKPVVTYKSAELPLALDASLKLVK
jgi:hypothetical protein